MEPSRRHGTQDLSARVDSSDECPGQLNARRVQEMWSPNKVTESSKPAGRRVLRAAAVRGMEKTQAHLELLGECSTGAKAVLVEEAPLLSMIPLMLRRSFRG